MADAGYEYEGQDITLNGADLGRDLYRGVVLTDTLGAIANHGGTAVATAAVVLRTPQDDNDTDPVCVRVSGVASMRAESAITVGDVVTLGTTDNVKTTTTANDTIIGIALATCGIGDLVPVHMYSGFALYPT